MKNKDIHCDEYRSTGALPHKEAKNTVLFYHSLTGIVECYNIVDLYQVARDLYRRWEDRDNGETNYRYPVFSMKHSSAKIDYETMGLALGCGFNTIVLTEKHQVALYDSGLEPFVHLDSTVHKGIPVPRQTILSNDRSKIHQEANKIRESGDFSIFNEDEDFVDSNWSVGLTAPINVPNLRPIKEIKESLKSLERTLRILYKRNMITEQVKEETGAAYRRLTRELERSKSLGANVLFVFADEAEENKSYPLALYEK